MRRYGHLSTGNYNPRTARLYTDLSYLTADSQLTTDMENVFVHLAGQSRLPKLHKLWMAPFYLHKRFVEKIDAVAAAAVQGQPGRIVAKMNALTDEALIQALVHAGQAGVKIDLIVRGACMLPAQRPGMTDNIRVRSIIGRFLEHARVFYFRSGDLEDVYLSSADWMNRNMFRRIELAWPVTDPVLKQRIIDECLVSEIHDGRDAWDMLPDGTYRRVDPKLQGHSAQMALMTLFGDRSKGVPG
jgi:polyphosphate kinase